MGAMPTTLQNFGFESGDVEVWYAKLQHHWDAPFEQIPIELGDLSKTHILLGTTVLPENGGLLTPLLLELLWEQLQGENWSPKGEARVFIRHKGLHHTSMSVGDLFCLRNQEGAREIYKCDSNGFTLLGILPKD